MENGQKIEIRDTVKMSNIHVIRLLEGKKRQRTDTL